MAIVLEPDPRVHFRSMNERSSALVALTNSSSFATGDVRDAFLKNTASALATYCVWIGLQIAAEQLKRPTGDEVVDLVLNALSTIDGIPTQNRNYYRARRRAHLFTDVWCAFEDALRILDEAVVPAEVRAKDKAGADGHVSIPTVWTRVSRAAKRKDVPDADGERQSHHDTVDFWAATRNTMHSNSLYAPSRPPKILVLSDGTEVKLTPGEHTDFHSESLLPLLIDALVEAWVYLRKRFDNLTPILTPASQLDSPYKYG